MSVATKTVTVNAAFLREIKQDAIDLRDLLECALAHVSGPRWMRSQPRRLLELIERLRDQLAVHFSLEEAYGYCDAPVAANPRLHAQAEALRSQHEALYLKICELVDEAERLLYHEPEAPGLARLTDEFSTFLEEFHEHEARENAMISLAFEA